MNVNKLDKSHFRRMILLFAMVFSWMSYSYGQIGCYALEFEASSSQFVQVNAAEVCPQAGSSFTVAAWFYLNTLPTGPNDKQAIFSIVDAAAGDNDGSLTVRVENGAGDLRVFSYDGGVTVVDFTVTTANLVTNTWYHVAVVSDGTNLDLYLDGDLKGTDNTPLTAACTSNTLLIGRRRLAPPPANNDYFNGQIDEVALWTTDLSESDIDNLVLETTTVLATENADLVGYYDFETGSGTTAFDQNPNLIGPNPGTLNNMDDTDWVFEPIGSLGCHDNIGIPVLPANSCVAVVVPNQLLTSNVDNPECYEVTIFEQDGVTPLSPPNQVDGSHIGLTLPVLVTHVPSGNSCNNGTITVQDNVAPMITCPADATITCGDNESPTVAGTGVATATDCASPVTISSIDSELPGPCPAGPLKTITRTWTASDGNLSSSCVQTIIVNRITLASVTIPANMTIDCAASTLPANTGFPQGNGIDLTPTPNACGLSATYSDMTLNPNGVDCGNRVIFRTWTIMSNCEGMREETQVITLTDDTGPVFTTCPADLTVSTTQYDCESGPINLPTAIATDDCSTVTYSTTVDGNPVVGNIVADLAVGDHTVVVMAMDACGNPSAEPCEYVITVQDLVPPAMSCETSRTITLNGNGPTLIPAVVFDDGSWDNCGTVTFLAQRMDSPDCEDNIPAFAEFVPFYCCDENAAEPIMVILQADDGNGNVNTCMVEVIVDDKTDPEITCPPNVTVDCWEDTDPANTGEATAEDYCQPVDVDHEDSFTPNPNFPNCNLGTITRTWTATDPSGNTDVCTQTIVIANLTPFTEDDIEWPQDFGDTGCTLPSTTGEPEYDDGPCDLISHNILNETEYDVANGCVMIEREWIVVDFCQAGNGPGGYAAWTHTQTIVVLNSEAPEILNCGPSDDFCSYDPDCEEGNATLTVEVQDDCNDINFMYRVDAFDDGPGPDDQDWTPDDDGDVTNAYPLGTHRVYWKIFDGCNNTVLCDYEFTIKDCKAPNMKLHDQIERLVMQQSGMIEVFADEWDMVAPVGPTDDNCELDDDSWLIQVPSMAGTYPDPLVPPVTATPSYTFECVQDNLQAGSNVFTVDIFVKDVNGNWSYLTVDIDVEDNFGVCGPIVDYAVISGGILNEEGDEVEHVHVEASGDLMNDEQMTGNAGVFAFDLPMYQNYTVTPDRDDNILNGVSTLDLVKINKHILQTELLASPYKLIAADVNHSGAVSAIDMVELRKVILFIETEFPNNTSWRFVDAAFVFPDPADPFATPFPEVYTVNGLTEDEVADFVGVKIGDVNCSATPNDLAANGDDRNGETLQFVVNDQELTIGETFTVDFNAADFKAIEGFQFTLDFDTEALELDAINAAKLSNLDDNNFGTHLLSEGVITASWNTFGPAETLQDGETVFSMTFTAKANGQLRDLLSLNSRYTTAEAYVQNEVADLGIIFSNDNGVFASNQLELFQNRPNPFKDETVIGFNLPEAGKATMTIFDISGRTIHVIDGDFAKGYNEISLNRSDLQATGVMYYQLESANSIASMKMVLMD